MDKDKVKQYSKLVPYVKILLEHGNKLAKPVPGFAPNSDGFYQDKDGWKCDLKNNIDFSLLQSIFSSQPEIVYSSEKQSVFDNSTWSEIRGNIQETPS